MGQYDYTNLTNFDITNNNKLIYLTIQLQHSNIWTRIWEMTLFNNCLRSFNNFWALFDHDRKHWSRLIWRLKLQKIQKYKKYKNTKLQKYKIESAKLKSRSRLQKQTIWEIYRALSEEREINSAELRINIWNRKIYKLQNTKLPPTQIPITKDQISEELDTSDWKRKGNETNTKDKSYPTGHSGTSSFGPKTSSRNRHFQCVP